MTNQKGQNEMKNQNQIKAEVTGENCKIKLTAQISGKKGALTPEELREVKRKLQQNLSGALSNLPFHGAYPHEVSFS